MTTLGTKSCSLCGHSLRSDNSVGICKTNPECVKANKRRYRELNLVQARARENAWYKREGNWRYRTLSNIRHRAKISGQPCDISIGTLPAIPDHCPCCGSEMSRQGAWQNQPSLDRIVPYKGYVLANTQWLCRRCNQRKNNFTLAELRQLVSFMEGLGLDDA